MSNGNMCFAVIGDDLLVRVGPDAYGPSLALPYVREMDLTGRPLRGMVLVDGEGLAEDESLREWLELGLAFTDSLPPKVTGIVRPTQHTRRAGPPVEAV
jgi:hypothetical protein